MESIFKRWFEQEQGSGLVDDPYITKMIGKLCQLHDSYNWDEHPIPSVGCDVLLQLKTTGMYAIVPFLRILKHLAVADQCVGEVCVVPPNYEPMYGEVYRRYLQSKEHRESIHKEAYRKLLFRATEVPVNDTKCINVQAAFAKSYEEETWFFHSVFQKLVNLSRECIAMPEQYAPHYAKLLEKFNCELPAEGASAEAMHRVEYIRHLMLYMAECFYFPVLIVLFNEFLCLKKGSNSRAVYKAEQKSLCEQAQSSEQWLESWEPTSNDGIMAVRGVEARDFIAVNREIIRDELIHAEGAFLQAVQIASSFKALTNMDLSDEYSYKSSPLVGTMIELWGQLMSDVTSKFRSAPAAKAELCRVMGCFEHTVRMYLYEGLIGSQIAAGVWSGSTTDIARSVQKYCQVALNSPHEAAGAAYLARELHL